MENTFFQHKENESGHNIHKPLQTKLQELESEYDGETLNIASIKQLLDSENLIQFSSFTTKGWFMLIICSVGIPVIIAWRSTLTKYSRKTGEEKKSIYDKLK